MDKGHATAKGRDDQPMPTRRTVLKGIGAAAAALGCGAGTLTASTAASKARLIDVLRIPDRGRAFTGDDSSPVTLELHGDHWSGGGIDVHFLSREAETQVSVTARSVPVTRIHLRWTAKSDSDTSVLGDAWERSYGDLAWLAMQPERVMPWYFLTSVGDVTNGYGVKVGAGAFAFWQCDQDGVSLWLDVRNGSEGVELGDRSLLMATIVSRQGIPGEGSFASVRALCRQMFRGLSLPTVRGGKRLDSIYGSNDWYYAYGRNTPEGVLRDADLMAESAPSAGQRPFTVIDDGYQDVLRFPSMEKLADDIRKRGVVPGIWVRPLRAKAATPQNLLLPAGRFGAKQERAREFALDPTIPEARALALEVVAQARSWGYELIKHDYTTYDLLGQWGNEMGASPTTGDWHLHDKARTNAEIIREFYQDIRQAAGEDRLILGCNVVGHLSGGIFDAQRTGDDVSGHSWERTRRMGVNTLGFRLPQDGIFFSADADCVPITKDVSWSLSEQWLRLVASTRTVLLISPEPGSVGVEQKNAIRTAFQNYLSGKPGPEPLDWKTNRTPEVWKSGGELEKYDWIPPDGASPFPL